MKYPIVTNEQADKAILEALALLKVLRILRKVKPERRAAVLAAVSALH